jgi:hypothetical protein
MLVSVTYQYGQGFLTPIPSIYPSSVKKVRISRMPVAHTYKPTYSVGRDQEGHVLKPDQANDL